MKSFTVSLSLLILLLFFGCGGGGGGDSASSTAPTCNYPAGIVQASGNVPMLVIRLQYNDVIFTSSATTWSNKIFGTGPNQLNDYFQESSHGQFQLLRANETEGVVNDGVITVSLNKNHPDSGFSSTIYSDLTTAITIASDDMNFQAYDLDNNGKIALNELQLIFIVAGGEDAYAPSAVPSVWAHSNCLYTAPFTDGVTVMACSGSGRFALFGERHGDHDATVGIIAHELGHAAFLLPDLYDTVDPNSYGIGLFGMMGYGNWGATAADEASSLYGNTPTHFSAWSKSFNGWVTPQTLNGVNSYDINLTESASASFNIVKLPINRCEYFLLENRNNSGYDEGLYSLGGVFDGGMAIWHIDESVIAQNYIANSVNNNESHRGVDMEEASSPNLDSGGLGHETNLYYLGNRTLFSPATSPNSNSYSGSTSGITVESISSRGAVMSATITN